MAMSQEKLAQIVGHSRTLCSEAGSKLVRSKGNTNIPSGGFDINPMDVSDEWDNFSLNEGTIDENTNTYIPSANYSNETVMNSKLPDSIKESFMKQRIEAPDTMRNIAAMVQQQAPVIPQRQRLTESPMQTTPIQPTVGATSIDYNYLKYIISECISDYFSKNPVNGNGGTLKQINLVAGKIKLVDDNGNIYAAQLERVGNVKDKKK